MRTGIQTVQVVQDPPLNVISAVPCITAPRQSMIVLILIRLFSKTLAELSLSPL